MYSCGKNESRPPGGTVGRLSQPGEGPPLRGMKAALTLAATGSQTSATAVAPPLSWAADSWQPPPLSTATGALALIGALTAVAGATSTDPTCTVPMEWTADWLPDASPQAPHSEPADTSAPPVSCCALELPVSPARLTGAFTFTGVFTAVTGAITIDPSWIVSTEPRACWPSWLSDPPQSALSCEFSSSSFFDDVLPSQEH